MIQRESSLKKDDRSSLTNKSTNMNEAHAVRKDVKMEDTNIINMDDIFHLDSIPGLANILADDSIDPSTYIENSNEGVNKGDQNIHDQNYSIELKDGGSKFSQFFQHDSIQTLELSQSSSAQMPPNIKRSERQEELSFKGNFQCELV